MNDMYNLRRVIYLQDVEIERMSKIIAAQKAEIDKLEGIIYDLREQVG